MTAKRVDPRLRHGQPALGREGAGAGRRRGRITPNPSARRTPTASSCPASAPSRRRWSRCASGAWTSSWSEIAGRPARAGHLPRHAAAVRLVDRDQGRGRSGTAGRPRRSDRGERIQGPAHRLVAGALGAPRADRGLGEETRSFVHSFVPRPEQDSDVLGTAEKAGSASPARRAPTPSTAFPRRSRAPRACACSRTSRASAAPPRETARER